jgi:hypothetical protein
LAEAAIAAEGLAALAAARAGVAALPVVGEMFGSGFVQVGMSCWHEKKN